MTKPRPSDSNLYQQNLVIMMKKTNTDGRNSYIITELAKLSLVKFIMTFLYATTTN